MSGGLVPRRLMPRRRSPTPYPTEEPYPIEQSQESVDSAGHSVLSLEVRFPHLWQAHSPQLGTFQLPAFPSPEELESREQTVKEHADNLEKCLKAVIAQERGGPETYFERRFGRGHFRSGRFADSSSAKSEDEASKHDGCQETKGGAWSGIKTLHPCIAVAVDPRPVTAARERGYWNPPGSG